MSAGSRVGHDGARSCEGGGTTFCDESRSKMLLGGCLFGESMIAGRNGGAPTTPNWGATAPWEA
eukprot:1800429-Alexandrium_andersonii.AAC.1